MSAVKFGEFLLLLRALEAEESWSRLYQISSTFFFEQQENRSKLRLINCMNHFCEGRWVFSLLLCNLIILYVLTSFMNLMEVESVVLTFYFKEYLRGKNENANGVSI